MRAHEPAGFTLIELTFSLSIIAIIILAAVAAVGSASRVGDVHRERTAALFAATAKIEEAIAADFAQVKTTWNGTRFQAPPLTGTNGSVEVGEVRITVESDPDPDTLTDDVLFVEAIVSWSGAAGPQDLALSTRLSQRR